MTLKEGFNFGFEQEFFVASLGGLTMLPPPYVARDNAGYLVEARSDFDTDITKAIFSLDSEIYRIQEKLLNDGMSILYGTSKSKLSERLKLEAYRKYGLPIKDKLIANLYDEALTDEQIEFQYAGTHINISLIRKITRKDAPPLYITEPFDHVPIIKWLDNYFKEEIENSERLRGSYSIKRLVYGDGLEYRSLPNTVNLYNRDHTNNKTTYYRKNLRDALMIMKKELDL